MYTTREEARNRLAGTIVAYDGQPLKVLDVGGRDGAGVTLSCLLWPFDGNTAPVAYNVNDPLFVGFRTPTLGFANYFERGAAHAVWCHRVPARRMQQGLVNGNFNAVSLGVRAMKYGLDQIASSEAFREMLVGEYPSFDTAMATLVPDSSIAVAREFALLMSPEGYVTIYHRRDPLGLVMGGVIFLREDRQYAREMLVECEALPNDIQNL